MQGLFSQARVAIGVGISDGLPGALVEAMENGAFPIQSQNSCADLFIDNGVNGFIVDPWNLDEIKLAIKKSLEDDLLVDDAQIANPAKLESVFSWELGVNRLRSLYTDD
jgi:glycosyltransferase involved in cell wall biosynthesis